MIVGRNNHIGFNMDILRKRPCIVGNKMVLIPLFFLFNYVTWSRYSHLKKGGGVSEKSRECHNH